MPQYLSPGVYVEEVPSGIATIAGVGTSTAGFIGIVPDSIQIPSPNPDYDPSKGAATTGFPSADAGPAKVTGEGEGKEARAGSPRRKGGHSSDGDNKPFLTEDFKSAAAGEIKLITSWSEFKKHFGDFSTDSGHRYLAHAVYGFFNNGGTRAFVVREKGTAQIVTSALPKFEAIDEIAIVAAPGATDAAVRNAITSHCENTGDRFAVFDCPELCESDGSFDPDKLDPPQNSDYAAFYFPWLQVFDPATKCQNPNGDGRMFVPPSGHLAGIYARVDAERGVHKAPANEPVRGALNLKYRISKAQQDGLNPRGVNCIRDLNGNIRVWGARTTGGDANGEWKYINVRRLFLYLRESIDKGTQWVVFEPNSRNLWAKITRNVTAFLTNVWRDGALFGATPQEAFYVKCDAETNPLEVRDLGQVVVEIGVCVNKPAEFVIFRISQWAGAGTNS
jgi:hypothetical protein